ncbi:MAG: S8 family peptidase, partial [Candidatus Hodarchaeales archaeon]
MNLELFKIKRIYGLCLIGVFFIAIFTQFPQSSTDFKRKIEINSLNKDNSFVPSDIDPSIKSEIKTKVEIEGSSENTSNIPGFQSKPSQERFFDSLNHSSPSNDHKIEQQLSDTPVSEWKTSFSQFMISFDSMTSMHDFTLFNRVKKLDNIPICVVNVSYDSITTIKNVDGVTGVYADFTNKVISETWSSQSTVEIRSHYETFLQNVKLDTLHSLGLTGSGVTIAILDTGIDANHPDLDDLDGNPATSDSKVILEKSFIDYDGDGIADTSPLDHMGHGTHVAGIAAANGILTGAAPDAWLLNGKVLDNNGYGSTSWLISGIDWAITNGANIISLSLSLGDSTVSPIMETAIQYAWENNVLVVAAAGNSGPFQNSVSSLGLTTRTLTVGASGPLNSITPFSSRGPSIFGEIKPNVVAPGESVFSTVTRSYMQSSGTSMATPIVSGLAAVLQSSNSSIGVDSIRSAIISTATNLDYHTFSQGAGLVNAEQAYFFLQHPSISAFPAFPEYSKLTLSPREQFEYQFDVYLNGSYNSVSVDPSPELIDYVNISPLATHTGSWLRFQITINMSEAPINGDLIVKNGSIEYLL